jgi:hypothetical protein
MTHFVIFCKSYRNDVLRVKKLLESLPPFNKDKIPFHLSVPRADLDIFKNYIHSDYLAPSHLGEFYLLTDEKIISSNSQLSLDEYYAMPGSISQQLIKAEAWRKIGCDNYLCIDADSYFTKEFSLANFMHPSGHPYSLMHDANDLLDEALQKKKHKVIANFKKDCQIMKTEFEREGPDYDFGPTPVIWSRLVWESLEKLHLMPRKESIAQAMVRLPQEIKWYGEALLKYKAIPLYPIGPLFECLHYEWQSKKTAEVHDYIGIVSQSNWDKHLDPKFARRSFISRSWGRLRRMLRGLLIKHQ